MKIKLIAILISAFWSFNASAQAELSQAQKFGACAGYHAFWAILSKSSGSYRDFNFSMDVADSLDRRFSSNKEYQSAQSKAFTSLTNAFKQNNFNLIRSFAGICVEVNQPIGQNSK